MICEKTELELDELHREAGACCVFLAKTLVQAGCPKDEASLIIRRFATLYCNLGLDVERMEGLL